MAQRRERYATYPSWDKSLPESSLPKGLNKASASSSICHFIPDEITLCLPIPIRCKPRRFPLELTERRVAPCSRNYSRCFPSPTVRTGPKNPQFTSRRSHPGTGASIGKKLFQYIFRSRTRRDGPTIGRGEQNTPKGGDGQI